MSVSLTHDCGSEDGRGTLYNKLNLLNGDVIQILNIDRDCAITSSSSSDATSSSSDDNPIVPDNTNDDCDVDTLIFKSKAF